MEELHTIKTEKFHYENGSLRSLIDCSKNCVQIFNLMKNMIMGQSISIEPIS